MKLPLLALSVLLVSPAEGQRSPAIEAQQLPTYVTQLGKTHFPGGEAAGWDMGESIVALPSGAVVVAGRTDGSLGEPNAGPSGTSDAFVARFDRLGNLEWIRQIGALTAPTIPALNGNPAGPGGDASSYDGARDVAVAADGSVYVTGYTYGNLGETKIGLNGDFFLAKLDAHGSLQWLRQVGGETAAAFGTSTGASIKPTNDEDGMSVLVDPSGAVYVAGLTFGNLADVQNHGFFDPFLARFSPEGRLEWLRHMGGFNSQSVGFDSTGDDYDPEIALHPSGSIVMVCSSEFWNFLPGGNVDVDSYITLFTFDARSNPLASWSFPGPKKESRGDVAVDPRSGRIFVGGSTRGLVPHEDSSSYDAFVACFDIDLDIEWIRQIGTATAQRLGLLVVGSDEYFGALCTDAAGDVVLIGQGGSLADQDPLGGIFTAKLNGTSGDVIWLSQIGRAESAVHGVDANASAVPEAIAVGRDGSIGITGWTTDGLAEPLAGSGDVFVMRLTPEGGL